MAKEVSDDEWLQGVWPIAELIEDSDSIERDQLHESESEMETQMIRPKTDAHADYHDFVFRELRSWVTESTMGKAWEKMLRQKWMASRKTKTKEGKTSEEKPTPNPTATPTPITYKYDEKADRSSNIHALAMTLRMEEIRFNMRRIIQNREQLYVRAPTHIKLTALEEQKKATDAKRKTFKTEEEYWQRILDLEGRLDALLQEELSTQFDMEAHRLALYRRCQWKAQDRIDESNQCQQKPMSKEDEKQVIAKVMQEEQELGDRRNCRCKYVCSCDKEWMKANTQSDDRQKNSETDEMEES